MIENLREEIRRQAESYGSIPFWSWNDKLDPEELRRQIGRMQELHMKGFFMHARGGLETEYLSDEWFACIAACADEAEKRGMEAWLYDENGWPSGFAGGELLKDPSNYAAYLQFERRQTPDAEAFYTYIKDGDSVHAVENGREIPEAKEYLCIYRRYCDSYVDTMDRRVTERFIAATHENYLRHFPDKLGKVMPGFFTDEPQYYRWATPWSDTIPVQFEKRYGYDVATALPALFLDYPGAEEVRYDYWRLCHLLFTENFAKPIYEWAEAHHCKITGHTIEESFLGGQMWCTGGVMPFYEYEHIPGIDHLCRGLNNDLSVKQVASVAAQLGKKRVLSEMFAACGWDVSPTELKRIAEWQYAAGINLMCQHLYAYSIRGQRKTDYPAHYSEHLPWQDAFGTFNTYFNRLGCALSMGTEAVNTLVLHPIHSAYLRYRREEDASSIRELETATAELVGLLSENQIAYHFGDETLMAKYGSVEEAELIIGNCRYRYVVVPFCETVDATTAALLKKFLAGGGKVYLYGAAPTRIDGRIADLSWLRGNIDFAELKAAAPTVVSCFDGTRAAFIRSRVMRRPEGDLFYFLNLDAEKKEGICISLRGCRNAVGLNLETLEEYPLAGEYRAASDAYEIRMDFDPGASYLFAACPPVEPEPVRIFPDFRFTYMSGSENAYTLDRAQVSYGGGAFGDVMPIAQIRDLTLRRRFAGEMRLRFSFEAKTGGLPVSLACEPMRYNGIWVNGTAVSLSENWWLDRSFRTADIGALVHRGTNTIEMSFEYYQRQAVYDVLYGNATESLRNCLHFDTEIEAVYLFGDFGVSTAADQYTPADHGSLCYTGDFTLTRRPDTVSLTNVVREGFPFFAGKISLCGKVILPGPVGADFRRVWLHFKGRYAYADFTINGKAAERLFFRKYCDVTKLVRPGENTVTVTMCNSARNLLGPHHDTQCEPLVVAPGNFTLEKCWTEAGCEAYRPSYSFMPFGGTLYFEVE